MLTFFQTEKIDFLERQPELVVIYVDKNSCYERLEALNEKLGNQIPGLQKKSFFERSCERIKTLATSMNETRIYEKCRQLAEKSSVSTEN